jgi:glucose/arabinose dehydrogenase
LVFSAEHPKAPAIYATGLRNCVGLAWQPSTGNLWCTVNERDQLGDGFATFHGSWNRASRTGQKLVRVRLKDGRRISYGC